MEFGQIVKRSVEKEGLLGWQFNTIGVSDAITMGGDGKRLCLSFLFSLTKRIDTIRNEILSPI